MNLRRIILKFNRRETETKLQLLTGTLGNKVNRVLKLQIHQKKSIFMSELGGGRQLTAIVLQKEYDPMEFSVKYKFFLPTALALEFNDSDYR